MLGAVERLIGLRYLGGQRSEGLISVITGFSIVGIALAVGTLIVVMSVMTGFRHEVLRQLGSVSGQLLVQQGVKGFLRDEDLEQRIAATSGITGVAPIVEGRGLAVSGAGARGVLLRGIETRDLRKREPLVAAIEGSEQARARFRAFCGEAAGDTADWGNLKQFAAGEGAVIGRRLAELLDVRVGDELTLVSSEVRATPLGLLPRTVSVRVGAFFCAGMYDFDSSFVFLPLGQAQSLLDMEGKVSSIEVSLADPARVAEFRSLMRSVVPQPYFVAGWVEVYGGFFAAIEAQTNVLFVVLLLIMLVAAFNIVSGLTMLARTKTSDIAILRTMGARRGTILRSLLLTGFAIGATGTLAGTVLGLLFASNIEAIRRLIQRAFNVELFDPQMRMLAEIPTRLDPLTITTIALVSLAFSLLATLLPAWRASRLDPATALRRD